jgi:hypothetical protein
VAASPPKGLLITGPSHHVGGRRRTNPAWDPAQVGEDECGERLRDQELVGDRLVVSAGSTTSPQA